MMYLVFGEQELLVNKMIDKLAKSELNEIDDFVVFVLFDYLVILLPYLHYCVFVDFD